MVKKYQIDKTFEEISQLSIRQFKILVKEKVKKVSFEYLVEKKNKKENGKGRHIKYKVLEMADYLLPSSPLSVNDKIEIFKLRSEMNEIPSNFGKPVLCKMACGKYMNNEHYTKCSIMNKKGESKHEYSLILNGTLSQKIETYKKIHENREKMEKIEPTSGNQ